MFVCLSQFSFWTKPECYEKGYFQYCTRDGFTDLNDFSK